MKIIRKYEMFPLYTYKSINGSRIMAGSICLMIKKGGKYYFFFWLRENESMVKVNGNIDDNVNFPVTLVDCRSLFKVKLRLGYDKIKRRICGT